MRNLFSLCIYLLLTGCATSIPTEYERPVSTALSSPESTELGRLFQGEKAALYRWVEEVKNYLYPIDTTSETVMTKLETLRNDFIWAPVVAFGIACRPGSWDCCRLKSIFNGGT